VRPSPSKKFTINAARRRLGLGRGESVSSLEDGLSTFQNEQARLNKQIAQAHDLKTQQKYQCELSSLQEAWQVLQAAKKRRGSLRGLLVLFLVLLLFGAGACFVFQDGGRDRLDHSSDHSVSATLLERLREVTARQAQGDQKQEGAQALDQNPPQDLLETGQQLAFFLGAAQSSNEAGQFAEAEDYCRQAELIEPNHPRLQEIRQAIRASQSHVEILVLVRSFEKAIQGEKWQLAQGHLEDLGSKQPAYPEIQNLRERLDTTREKALEDIGKAQQLVAKARTFDQESFSPEAIALLEQAMQLRPSDQEIKALHEVFSSRGKVLRVPTQYPTISAALGIAQPGDRVIVSEGAYQESLVIPAGVEVVGESRENTLVEYPATRGPVVRIRPGGRPVRLSCMTLKHQGVSQDEERFPIVSVENGHILMDQTTVSKASGHGVAVLGGGMAHLKQCLVEESGWDGISVRGVGARAVLQRVFSQGNLHHGIDFWEGASGEVSESQFLDNGRAGLVSIGSQRKLKIVDCLSQGNRELGFYLSGVSQVEVTRCEVTKNQLGGVLFDGQSKGVEVMQTRVIANGKAGLVIEKGVQVLLMDSNVVENNDGKQIWEDAVFSPLLDEDRVSPPPPAPNLPDEVTREE